MGFNSIEDELRSLGCSNHGCLVQPLAKGSMGTNAICSCWRRRTEGELQRIFMLKDQQYRRLARNIEKSHVVTTPLQS